MTAKMGAGTGAGQLGGAGTGAEVCSRVRELNPPRQNRAGRSVQREGKDEIKMKTMEVHERR